MKIKKGDNVKINIGKDNNKTGKVLQVLAKTKKPTRVVVEGLNLRYKHLRPKKGGEKGQRIMFPAPLNISNIKLICPNCGQATRVGYKKIEVSELNKEKKQRICKKCQALI